MQKPPSLVLAVFSLLLPPLAHARTEHRAGAWTYTIPDLGDPIDEVVAETCSGDRPVAGSSDDAGTVEDLVRADQQETARGVDLSSAWLAISCTGGRRLTAELHNLNLNIATTRAEISFDGAKYEVLDLWRLSARHLRPLMTGQALYVRWVSRLGTVTSTFSLAGSAEALRPVVDACGP